MGRVKGWDVSDGRFETSSRLGEKEPTRVKVDPRMIYMPM